MNARLLLLGVITLAACGGKVVVDGNGAGRGGAGGASSSTGSDIEPIDCGPVCQKIIAGCPWKEGHCECEPRRAIVIKAGCIAEFNAMYGCVLDQPVSTNCVPEVCADQFYPLGFCILDYCMAHEPECWP